MATGTTSPSTETLNSNSLDPSDPLKQLYPAVNEDDTPLPRSWSPKDKFNFIGLSLNNLRVHYKGKRSSQHSLLKRSRTMRIINVIMRMSKFARTLYQTQYFLFKLDAFWIVRYCFYVARETHATCFCPRLFWLSRAARKPKYCADLTKTSLQTVTLTCQENGDQREGLCRWSFFQTKSQADLDEADRSRVY